MNGKRVLLGGLVAGVFVNISEWILNAGILMDEYTAVVEAHGLTAASWSMAGYILGAFILAVAFLMHFASQNLTPLPKFGSYLTFSKKF